MATLDRAPNGTLTALRGIAITGSLLTTGQMGTIALLAPSLFIAAETRHQYRQSSSLHRLAAQQFAHQYRTLKAIRPPVELLTTAVCSSLAYLGYSDGKTGTWKLWAAAAVSMVAVIPFTVFLMEPPTSKLLWVSEVASSATLSKQPSITGIGVKVSGSSRSPSPHRNDALGVPGGSQQRNNGAITPMEEFEPFEDAVMDQQEYEQLKVLKLLKKFQFLNAVRVFMPLTAGVLCVWAGLSE